MNCECLAGGKAEVALCWLVDFVRRNCPCCRACANEDIREQYRKRMFKKFVASVRLSEFGQVQLLFQ